MIDKKIEEEIVQILLQVLKDIRGEFILTRPTDQMQGYAIWTNNKITGTTRWITKEQYEYLKDKTNG